MMVKDLSFLGLGNLSHFQRETTSIIFLEPMTRCFSSSVGPTTPTFDCGIKIMTQFLNHRLHLALAGLLLLSPLAIGCGGETGNGDEEGDSTTAAVTNVSIDDSLNAKLAEADAADGNADKTIHLCYSCALGMDGSAEHSVEVNGYTAHLCSEYCQESFSKDAETIVTDTKIPAPKSEEDETSADDDADGSSEEK